MKNVLAILLTTTLVISMYASESNELIEEQFNSF